MEIFCSKQAVRVGGSKVLLGIWDMRFESDVLIALKLKITSLDFEFGLMFAVL